MKKLFILLTSGLLLAGSCNKSGNDGRTPGGGDASVSPNDPVAVSAVLIIPNSQPKSGNIPETTNDPASPKLTQYEESVSYSYGGTVKLPFHYEDPSGKGISGIYAQVTGADSYFEIPVSGTGGSGEMVLPIGLPKNLETGKFQVRICVYVDDKVSNIFETDITVAEPMSCGVSRSSGGEGITSTLHDMGSQSGTVVIKYETYNVPDRIDVFYGGEWIAGTGSAPDGGVVPPLADCSNPTEGYVGEEGMFCFSYDPEVHGSEVEVVVSGCVRGGTEWKYEISCAGEDGCKLVESTLTLNGQLLNFNRVSVFVPQQLSIRVNIDGAETGLDLSSSGLIPDVFTANKVISPNDFHSQENQGEGKKWSLALYKRNKEGNYDYNYDSYVGVQDGKAAVQSGTIRITEYSEYTDETGDVQGGLINLEFKELTVKYWDEETESAKTFVISGEAKVLNY